MSTTLADRIDAVLPQTQCRRCSYDACRPYADAVARGEAIDRCTPGGHRVLQVIADLTGRRVPSVSGTPDAPPLALATIDEQACIGCTLCIDACPVDAIVGGPKRMHAVIAALCSGCELCLPVCPVDCIALVSAGRTWSATDAEEARVRHRRHVARRSAEPSRQARRTDARADLPAAQESVVTRILTPEERRSAVSEALARARARRAV